MQKKLFRGIGGIVILAIVFPLIKNGYIFGLDQALPPHGWYWFPSIGSNLFVVGIISLLTKWLLPMWILEKLLLIAAFVVPFAAGWHLFRHELKQNKGFLFAALFASLLLIFNPFLYSRIVEGQINIYMSYGVWVVSIVLFLSLLRKFDIKQAIWLGICGFLLTGLAIHNIFFIGLMFLVFVGIGRIKKNFSWKHIGFISISLVVSQLYLLGGVIFPEKQASQLHQIQQFDQQHLDAFATDNGGTSLYLNVLSLHGYRGEREKRFLHVGGDQTLHTIVSLLLGALVLYGIFLRFRHKKEITAGDISILTLMIISYILSLGVAEKNIFSSINQFLYDYLPFYQGMREPGKWIGVLVIGYAYFGAYGIKELSLLIKKNFSSLNEYWFLGLSVLPLLYSPLLFNGFRGQIKVLPYPETRKATKTYLDTQVLSRPNDICSYKQEQKSNGCYDTLIFPWHRYMTFKRIGKNVYSPVGYFGGSNKILFADNLEIRDIYTQSNRPESKMIEKYFNLSDGVFRNEVLLSGDVKGFFEDMQGLGIYSILLLKEVDFGWYLAILDAFVENKLLEVVSDTPMLKLYKISVY